MTSSSTQEWVDDDLAGLDLGDKRRDRRARSIVERLGERPGGSIAAVSEDNAEAKAIYRFLSNDAVEPDALRAPLRQAALQRLGDDATVVVPQDTTCLNFTTHPATEGLGPLGAGDGSAGYGIFVHSAIAVSAHGVPLGLVHQQSWARPATIGSKRRRKKLPLEEKESYRWLQTARAVEAAVPEDKQLIQIADREADIFELFAAERRENSYLLLRVYQDRRLEGDERLLWDKVEQTPVARKFDMLVHQSHQRTARKARLELAFCPVTIRPPRDGVHEPSFQPVTLNAIEVREVDEPEGAPPILWRLLTDLPVDSVDEALRCVRYYELRWLVERYHYVLKSGCGIEDSQLRTFDRLERLLALLSAVALRLLWMTYSARVNGDAPCTIAFSAVEWRVLYRYQTLEAPPDQPPSLRDAVLWLAQLGGFLARKGDGEPGVKVLWRGLVRLQDMVVGFHLASQDVGNA
jgi:hypothetical protein